MPCMDDSTDMGLKHDSELKKIEIHYLRKWLSNQFKMKNILQIPGNTRIEQALAQTGMKRIIPSARASLEADNEEYMLCQAVKMIGNQKLLNHLGPKIATSPTARKMLIWHEIHKERDMRAKQTPKGKCHLYPTK